MVAPLAAQTPSPSASPSSATSIDELRQRLEEVDRRLAEAPAPPIRGTSLVNEIPPISDSLRRLDVALRRRISLEEIKASLGEKIDALAEEFDTLTTGGLKHPKPYSVELLDELQAQLDIADEKSQSARLSNTAAKTTMELESAELENLQALRRRLLDEQRYEPNDLTIRRKLENLEVAIEAGRAELELAQAEIESSALEMELANEQHELVKAKLALVQESFKFSESTLEDQLKELEESRIELTEAIEEHTLDEKASQQKLQVLLSDDIDDEEQVGEIQSRREWVQTHQRKERLLEERLDFNLVRQELWERRYLAHSGQSPSKYDEWVDSARGLLVRLQKNRDILTTELSQIRTELSSLLDDESEEPSIGQEAFERQERWKDVRTQALVSRQKAVEETLRYEQETELLTRRLLAELNFNQETSTFSERAGRAWEALQSFWNIELYTLGDSSVTVGKVSIALFVLLVGLGVTGRLTRFLSSRFLTRLPIRENVRVNIERILSYLFVLLVFLFALHVVNIPLTIFTFLGGTLAIAAGFGAQNILNNFISGLILMVERPVRAGDLIEVDNTLGFVEEIGGRSTRIRIPSGIHVILPNSSLLENKVVNWTLHDNRLRIKVSVGVAYGSPTRKVIELIEQAVSKQEKVIKSPAPVVTFEDFGDSSLNFSTHFWITVVSPLDRDIVATQVRLYIDDLFREHDITIPFPQRDLNFNEPVPVRMVDGSES
jgi:potassium-dependent mechanosensitive channel